MNCPEHEEVELHPNMLKTMGFCWKCATWHDLITEEDIQRKKEVDAELNGGLGL